MRLSQQFLMSVLILGVVFVNGWTDAPNAIATAVATGALQMKKAVLLAAFCNLAGLLITPLLHARVADTLVSMVRFDAAPQYASLALICALISIILWSTAAWWFGIPTSESHSLIAGLTGSAFALGSMEGVRLEQWLKVLEGLVLSTALGFLLGYLLTKILSLFCRGYQRHQFQKAQVASAAFMAFMHGFQDGQKFVAVFIIGVGIARGQPVSGEVEMGRYIGIILICSVVMAAGTAFGGGRIIKTVGMEMVSLSGLQGFCADLSGGISLLFSTLWGLPVSTTHTKTTAIMGAGVARGKGKVDRKIVREMFSAWFLTFPLCMVLSFLLTRLVLHLQ